LAASLKNPKENLAKAQTYYAKAATFAFAWQAVLGENLRPGDLAAQSVRSPKNNSRRSNVDTQDEESEAS
jgi:hypothetical protein